MFGRALYKTRKSEKVEIKKNKTENNTSARCADRKIDCLFEKMTISYYNLDVISYPNFQKRQILRVSKRQRKNFSGCWIFGCIFLWPWFFSSLIFRTSVNISLIFTSTLISFSICLTFDLSEESHVIDIILNLNSSLFLLIEGKSILSRLFYAFSES